MRWLAVMAACAACSAPALPPDLARAEAHEKAGEDEAALAAYREASVSCTRITGERRRRRACAAAWLQRAELLENRDRPAEAAAVYEQIPEALDADPAPSSRALYRAGRIHLEAGDAERGWTLLWRTVTHYPDEPHAGDAVGALLTDGRRRDPRALYAVLAELLPALTDSRVGDNILYAMADLAEHELADPAAALAHYDRLAALYPSRADSGLYDEALWHGARLARAAGDARGATRRLKALLDTYEVSSLGIGSTLSVWLDNAQLELGRVLRDDLGAHEQALAAFRRLPRDYPNSILVDDAAFEAAVTLAGMGRGADACAALAKLRRDWPDSKFELERAPALRAELGCR